MEKKVRTKWFTLGGLIRIRDNAYPILLENMVSK